MIRPLLDDDAVGFHIVYGRADMRVHTWIVVNGPNFASEPCYPAIVEPWPSDFTYKNGASSWTPEAQQDILAYFTQGVNLPWIAGAAVTAWDAELRNGITAYLDTHVAPYTDHEDVQVGFAPIPSWVQTATYGAYPNGGSTYALAGTVSLGLLRQFNGADWGVAWGAAGLQSGARHLAIGGDYTNAEVDSQPVMGTTDVKVCDGRLLLHLGGDINDVLPGLAGLAWSSREDDLWYAALGEGSAVRPAPTAWYLALFDYFTGLELDPASAPGYARQSVTWDAITDAGARWPTPNGDMRGFQTVSLADVVFTSTGAWPRIGAGGLCKGPNAIFDSELPQLWCQYIGTSLALPPGSTLTIPAGVLKAFVY